MSTIIVKEWLKKAEEDYESATILIAKKGKTVSDVVCFLSQQCAEKYLKAFLVAKRIKFSKTHSLLELLKSAEQADPTLHLIYDLLKRLEPYAVDFRYSGEEATQREARLAVKAIAEVRAFLRLKLH